MSNEKINKKTNKKMAKNQPQVTPTPQEEVITKSEAFVTKYGKVLAIAVVAVLVIILGVFAYNTYYAGPRQDKASTELAKAQDLFGQEQYDKANTAFQKVISDFGGTDAANLAQLYSGLCLANTGKWAEAVKALEAFSTKSDAMISPAATEALGNAYAHVKDFDKAVSTLKKAAEMADKQSINGANVSLSPNFLLQAGILLESQNKNDEALQLYKDIKAKYVNSQLVGSQEIDKYIERLEQK